VLLEQAHKAVPESVEIPDQELGNQLIYRDVQLNKLKAVGLKPDSLTIEDGRFNFTGTPRVSGVLNVLYEHIVVTTEVRTIAKVFGKEIKQAVPVVHRDWRPKPEAPFTVRIEVAGTCTVTVTDGQTLNGARICLQSQA